MDNILLVPLLTQCQPLACKLATQQYDYQLNTQDLALFPVYDQVVEHLPDPETSEALVFVDRLFEQSGITHKERFWLNAWYEMVGAFQEFLSL